MSGKRYTKRSEVKCICLFSSLGWYVGRQALKVTKTIGAQEGNTGRREPPLSKHLCDPDAMRVIEAETAEAVKYANCTPDIQSPYIMR